MYVAYVAVLRYVPRVPAAWVVGGDRAGARDPAALAPAGADGRLQLRQLRAHGDRPPPQPVHDDPDLEPHSDPSFALSNWHQLLSPYGPLFTLLTFAVVPLGVAGSFWALKGILCVTSLAIILLVWRCAQHARSRPGQGDRARRAEPDRADLGSRRRPQRLPDDALHHAGASTCCCVQRGPRPGGGTLPGVPAARVARGWLLPISPRGGRRRGGARDRRSAIKASAAILIPVVLAALLRAPRRLVQVLLGMAVAAVGWWPSEPAGVRPAPPRSEHAGQRRDEREHPQPARAWRWARAVRRTRFLRTAAGAWVLACCAYASAGGLGRAFTSDRRGDHRLPAGRASRCS